MATLKSLTPVLIVDEVEPCAEFWTSRVGFEQTTQVPGDDGKVVFAILHKDGIELMYQTKASVAADSPDQKGELTGHTTALFFTVPSMADLDALESAMK